MSTFTKGEWHIENYATILDVSASGHGSICSVECDYREYLITPTDEQKANAHLIAAAPSMYVMLESISKGMDVWSIEEVKLLITKARGE